MKEKKVLMAQMTCLESFGPDFVAATFPNPLGLHTVPYYGYGHTFYAVFL